MKPEQELRIVRRVREEVLADTDDSVLADEAADVMEDLLDEYPDLAF